MATKDLYNNVSPAQSIRAQAVAAVLNGTGVNLSGYESATILIDLGTFAGTTPTATIKIQESSDDATYTDVAAADLLGGALPATIDTTNDETVYKRGYIGSKKFVRVIVSSIAGTGASLPMSAVVVRGHARHMPV
ncbi:hypothetical protein [Effusibacillus consociatus]|uniref:Uncharacterized protein n=1 Tax=Effusibacillus consociatus TaxID=1117041 RepID=A0ABV9Q2H9_9BACL